MFKKRLYPGMIGGILGAIILLWSPLSLGHEPSALDAVTYKRFCEDRLLSRLSNVTAKMHVLALYSKYQVQEIGNDEGYFFRRLGMTAEAPTIDMPLEDTRALWRMSAWQTESKRYQLLDAGFKNLADESNYINRTFLKYAERFPDANLRIRFPPGHRKERDALFMLRWRIHDAVLRKYTERKNYLSNSDFAKLSWATGYSDNSDAFALLSGDPKPADQMKWQELYQRLALTMQITYYGRRDYFMPTLRGGLSSQGMPDLDQDDMLPFEFRLRNEDREDVKDAVFKRFDKRTICELTRYVRFDSGLPREVHDKFLLQIIERLEGRGMKTVLASTDAFTARLFTRDYGFEVFMSLPTVKEAAKEYLIFIEVGSPRYEQLKLELKKSSKAVLEFR